MKTYLIPVNHTKICVREIGQGKPLILLHGFPQNSHGWDHLIPFLMSYYQLILIDLRGMGKSKICAKGLDKRNLARDVKQIIDYLKIQKGVIIGHDMGGIVAQRFALDYPDWVQKLICISTMSIGENHVGFFLNPRQLMRSWYIFFFQLPWLPEYILNKYAHFFIRHAFKHAIIEGKAYAKKYLRIKKYCLPQLRSPRNKAAINLYRSLWHDYKINKRDKEKRFNMPTLWIQGEKDPFIPSQFQNKLTRFSNLKVIIMENQGHWLPDFSSETVAQHIIKFIGR